MANTTYPNIGSQDLHLWLCYRGCVDNSDAFKRIVLSRYADSSPQALQFTEGEHGKPELSASSRPLHFNISHSGDWLACAVTVESPVGVDLEWCRPERASIRVARRFFRTDEVAALEKSDRASMVEQFYDYWTLKEAAVKARGGALAPGLFDHGFAIDYHLARPHRGLITATTTDTARYMLLDPVAGYRAALCWTGTAALPRLGLFELNEKGAVEPLKTVLRASSLCD